MKVALLHLSDIHIHGKNDVVLERGKHIAATLNGILPDVSAVIFVLTGDIAFSGEEFQYEAASNLISDITENIKSQYTGPIKYVLVPGNHDGKFKNSTGARTALIETVLSKGEKVIDDSVISICTAPQKEYFSFEAKYLTDVEYADDLWKEIKFNIDGHVIAFSCINASWMSMVPELPGRLMFPISNYQRLATTSCQVRIALMHHPLNWYAQTTYRNFKDLCRTHYQVVMSGHEHAENTYLIDDVKRGRSLTFEAGALAPHEPGAISQFSVLTLDLGLNRIAQLGFIWDGKSYIPQTGTPVWDSYLALPAKRTEGFEPANEIKNTIEDMGASFTHPNIERIKLSHLFVYPHLFEIDSELNSKEAVSAEILERQLNFLGKVLIRGDDQFGKTTLLHRLYSSYVDAGYIPILTSGKDLLGSTEDQLHRRFLRIVEAQYGPESPAKYDQLERDRKVLLLDDLDVPGAHPDAIGRLLEYIDKRYDLIVITVGDTFDIAELSSTKTSEITNKFKHFKLAGFGFELRTEIIKRWMKLGSQSGKDEFQKRVHEAQQVIDTVIGKGLVPTTAFNVLVILQTIEAGQRTALANAGLAQYYEFLVRQGLLEAKVKPDELDEIFNYLAGLAWQFSKEPNRTLDEKSLEIFNADFSQKVHKTNLQSRLDLLVRAKILKRLGSEYLFRYQYIRFFFKARYIASQLEDDDSFRNLVKHACNHLYLNENANTILFLTHHISSKWIIKEIAAVLSQLLNEFSPLNVIDDTAVLNKWITSTARVAIDASDVEKNRQKQRKQEDHAAAIKEPEHEHEVSSVNELDLIAQVNLLFKTSEILGQILKNKYGSLDKDLKADLLRELFDGPLRAITVFLEIINHAPDALIAVISNKMKEKLPKLASEAADRAAQRFIFMSLGNIADSFISRQGDIIGSPKLKDDISGIVKKDADGNPKEDVTYKLVSVAAQLSYPNNIPFSEIEFLSEKFKKNVFGYRLLQGIAARHLYMYSVPFEERQRLSHAAQIDVNVTKNVELTSSSHRKLPKKTSYQVKNPKSLIMRLQSSLIMRLTPEVKTKMEPSKDKSKSIQEDRNSDSDTPSAS